MPDLLSALQTLTGMLLDSQLLLEALPLISLWEHLALHAARSVHNTVLARLARATAAVRLGCMAVAAGSVAAVMAGAELPSPVMGCGLVLHHANGAAYQVCEAEVCSILIACWSVA